METNTFKYNFHFAKHSLNALVSVERERENTTLNNSYPETKQKSLTIHVNL